MAVCSNIVHESCQHCRHISALDQLSRRVRKEVGLDARPTKISRLPKSRTIFSRRSRIFGKNPLFARKPRTYDPTDWVRIDLDKLEQTVPWNVVMTVPEPTTIALLAMGTIGFLGVVSRSRPPLGGHGNGF